MNKRSIIATAVGITLLIILYFSLDFLREVRGILQQFKSFTLTIHNQSDHDIVSVETGILHGSDRDVTGFKLKDVHKETIKSGSTQTIKPNLSFIGEGGIYMKVTDSSGVILQESVCGYTESVAGHTEVTISKDEVSVDENCS